MSATLVVRMDEKRPNISIRGIADREANDFSLRLDNPAAPQDLYGLENGIVGDYSRGQAILAHSRANSLYSGNVRRDGLPQHATTISFAGLTVEPSGVNGDV